MLTLPLKRMTRLCAAQLTHKCPLSTSEVATALRPFYFAVHPDLFGQYPDQRTTNENSLKQLSSFIETLQTRRVVVPCNLRFYIRKAERHGQFQLVELQLRERDIRDVVLKVLRSCELPTDFVDKIPKMEPPKVRPARSNDIDLSNLDPNDPIFGPIALKRKIRRARDELRLESWINANFRCAIDKDNDNRPVRDEIDKMRRRLVDEWGLEAVRWECGWNELHFRGCLQSFTSLVEQHPETLYQLRGRLLVFAPFTGVSLDGHIMLNSGEVRHNWLDLIKNVRKYDAHLLRIPAFEKAVSQVLRDIKVVRRKFMPKILAGDYERNLQQITTSLGDFLTHHKFPDSWPDSLVKYEIVIETEAGPMMVSPTGQFIVPSTCPGFLLVSFITDNLDDASLRMENYKRNKYLEKSLHSQCVAELNLLGLRKDDNVNPDLMIECCEKLLRNKERLVNLSGVKLNIATYYSVLSDGVVCIPWNWEL